MIKAIEKMLNYYKLEKTEDYINALREILQEITLLGLWRGKFFEKAAFNGGTALRILYNLDRFSEDLDFSLLKPENNFNLEKYIEHIKSEINSFGFDIEVQIKEKTVMTPIQSSFLKANTKKQFLIIQAEKDIMNQIPENQKIKIKIELDTDPVDDFSTETKYLLQPIPFSVKSYCLPDLFAGKMHAILCRNWKNRVKGRDWYDLVWYVTNHPELHLNHLELRMKQTGHLNKNQKLHNDNLYSMYKKTVDKLDIEQIKNEVIIFTKNSEFLSVWSKGFFLDIGKRIKIV